MLRYTETGKWRDTWFMSLTDAEKVLFSFICDNCDNAGILDFNYDFFTSMLKKTRQEITDLMNNIRKCFVTNKNKEKNKPTTKIFIKNFLIIQQCTPLNLNNREHKSIYKKLCDKLDDFNNAPEIKKYIDEAIPANEQLIITEQKTKKKVSKKPKVDFIPPTEEEFVTMYLSLGGNKDNGMNAYNHYVSVGWVVGKSNKKMVDWKAACKKCYHNELIWAENSYKNYNNKNNQKTAKDINREKSENYKKQILEQHNTD